MELSSASAPVQGRMEQMEAIMAEFEAGLLRYAARIVGSDHHAQDVVQNAFIKLFRSWQPGMRPSARLKSWLYRVTHNEAIDLMRSESRRSLLHARHAEQTPSQACTNGIHCPGGNTEKIECVMAELRRLKPAERQVLLLRLEEGLSYDEIAAATGRTRGNVGSILHNAVKKLADRLQTGSRNPHRGNNAAETGMAGAAHVTG